MARRLLSSFAVRRLIFSSILELSLLSIAACMDPGSADVAVLPGLETYRSKGYVKVNAAPYISDLDPTVAIDVWVSRDAVAAYQKIADGQPEGAIRLPDGTCIVREVQDARTGEVKKLTVMIKAPPGHAPEIGDWYFAVTDENGVPLVSDAGRPMAGDLTDCYSCHQEHATTDFLFGVPLAVRPGQQKLAMHAPRADQR